MNTEKTSGGTRYPTIVNLKDLAVEGESFYFSRQSGELNSALRDLIQDHDHHVEITLRPMGNAFEITGCIKAEMDLSCSHCGRDMLENINDQFSELIVVLEERPRAGHSGHTGGHLHEEGPFCNYLSHHSFDLAEFTHEHIAAAEPYAPRCQRPDCDQHYQMAQGMKTQEDPPASESHHHSPFSVLKNLTVKKIST